MSSPCNIFLQNIYAKSKEFDVPTQMKSDLAVFTEAWKKDPRIIALFDDLSSSSTDAPTSVGSVLNYGLIGGLATGRRLRFVINYTDVNVDEVRVLNSSNSVNLSVKSIINSDKQKNGFSPERLIFVTDSGEKLWDLLKDEDNLQFYKNEFSMFKDVSFNEIGFPGKGCKYRAFEFRINCLMPPSVFDSYEKKAKAKSAQLARALGIDSPNVPIFVKIFIAFGYIQQEVDYDSSVAEKLSNGEELSEREILSLTAYGALCQCRATSRGLADALEWLLDSAGVGSEKIDGRLNELGAEPEYYWNIVWLDNLNKTAFCDCGYGIENARANRMVDSTAFLKTVNDFIDLKYDIWVDAPAYVPKSVNISIDDIIDYINQNTDVLKSFGIPEKYLLPGIIKV